MTLELNRIYNMDCEPGMELIGDNSVDLIFTDPPYVADLWEAAYTTLATHAQRILKPSGYLITYAGHYHLNLITKILDEKLTFFWIVAQLNGGATALVMNRLAICAYKPILIYQKPPMMPCKKGFVDVIKGKRCKEFHPWQQDIHEALHLISRFTEPGDLIVDPFVGSGTTTLAAKLLGDQYIGFEVNPSTYKTALSRMRQSPIDLGMWC